jgi:hypothetical protein
MKRLFLLILLLSAGFHQFAYAQETLAVLPLRGIGIEVSAQETVYQLLLSDIKQFNKYTIVPESDIIPLLDNRDCTDAACAVEIGTKANASKVAFGSLNKLGEKIIFQYDLVDVASGKTLLSDNMTALRLEDLDQVTKRVAASIVNQIPAEKTVEVGLVTEQESREQETRKAKALRGIGFGYLYPENGYDREQRVFVWDFRSLYEMRHFAVDALLGIRKGFSINIGFLYLTSPKDLSPYIGAGIGFHAISHEPVLNTGDSYVDQQEKAGDGLELLIKGGLLTFRTYDFRIVATVEYSLTFNDYHDRAVVVTIGVIREGKRIFGIF